MRPATECLRPPHSGLRLRRRRKPSHARRKVSGGACAGGGHFERVDRGGAADLWGARIRVSCANQWAPDGTVDLAFTNGVFHHIPPGERAACLGAIRRALRAGGLFAFWDNNPWNPGTHYVMSQCAFDRNAIKISPREAKTILSRAGFKVLRTHSLFYFPRQLRWLRRTESWLRRLPFGGQYLVLCRSSE